jgi:hypothetical protein
MTIISTIISRHCTAHASDSLVTRKRNDGIYEILDDKTTKIIPVPRWAGAMAYWGLATTDDGWSTVQWLRKRISQSGQFGEPEEFARDVGNRLNSELSAMRLCEPLAKGIGIHFTAYERVDNYPIPELFVITNFDNTQYSALHADGIHVTRETYGVAFQTPDRSIEHGKPDYRHQVRKYLEASNVLLFNNGDPFMFNTAFSAIDHLFRIAQQRRILKPPTDPKAHRDVIGWPIELVYKVQRYFVKEGYQMVGGKPHNLSITPRAEYESDTGDAP